MNACLADWWFTMTLHNNLIMSMYAWDFTGLNKIVIMSTCIFGNDRRRVYIDNDYFEDAFVGSYYLWKWQIYHPMPISDFKCIGILMTPALVHNLAVIESYHSWTFLSIYNVMHRWTSLYFHMPPLSMPKDAVFARNCIRQRILNGIFHKQMDVSLSYQ